MSKRILILGKTGMLGHMVERVLSADGNFEISGTHITDSNDSFYFRAENGVARLEDICRKNSGYDYVINCIGITADRIRADDSDLIVLATLVNSCFPHQLARLAEQLRFRVIHISTDGVFSGDSEFYDEDAPHDCIDVYGKTKSIGEVLGSANFLNIRCSIFGPSPIEKRGLFEWFRSQPDGGEVSGFTSHLWNGITTVQFAELSGRIIEEDKFDQLRSESPVFHFSPNTTVSKCQLLEMLKDSLCKSIDIKPTVAEGRQIKRILKSKYVGLRNLYGENKSMIDAISELVKFV